MRLRSESKRGIKRNQNVHVQCSRCFTDTTSGIEDGITLCYTAIWCYFLHRMILLHFVSFLCASVHVFAGTFGNPAKASPLLSSIGEFDLSSKTFTAYLERLVANDIEKCADFVKIAKLATDRHVQVRAHMKVERPDIKHNFDVRHVAKSVQKN